MIARLSMRFDLAALSIVLLAVCGASKAEQADTLASIMQVFLQGDTAQAMSRAQAMDSSDPQVRELMQSLRAATVSDENASKHASALLAEQWGEAQKRFTAQVSVTPNSLPESVTKLATTSSKLLVVDSAKNIAWIMRRSSAGWQMGNSFYVSVGSQGAGKQRRGDKRTPLGVYWLTEELDTQQLPARYGVRAFPLDYPNVLDRHFSRTGDGIWLHGITPAAAVRPPRDTDGCVAFSNPHIERLAGSLQIGRTPIIIGENIQWRDANRVAPVATELELALSRWAQAWSRANEAAYFSAYIANYRGMLGSPSLWRAGRRAALRARTINSVAIDDVEIYRADAEREIYLTRFSQTLSRGSAAPIKTVRRLYWQRTENGWKIIAAQSG